RDRPQGGEPGRGGRTPLVFALDEVAYIAPLPDLPAMVSEGGSQGVVTLACLQDLSQARSRWGDRAEGFLSLFGTTVVLPGIGDVRTLEAMSTLAGEHEIQTRSVSAPAAAPGRSFVSTLATRLALGPMARARDKTPTVTSSSTYRRRLPPDVVARGREGHALMVDEGNKMSWLALTRSYESWPWCDAASPPGAFRREPSTDPEPRRTAEAGRPPPRPTGRDGPGRSLA
ncbi:MAG: TraM recognition domain-containing protein, partial [Nitrososphaerales archaeon]